jgi:predicted DNA-binding transcriptional regulator YafY
MERLVRLMAVLTEAGEAGEPSSRLIEVAGFDGDEAGDQLAREFRHLRNQGWQIDNIAPPGTEARWRLTVGDSRLRLSLDARQQKALQRAVLLSDRADLAQRLGVEHTPADPHAQAQLRQPASVDGLDLAIRAVQRRALLRFRYNGKPRVVHPASVRHQNNQWYVSGREDGVVQETTDGVKHFVVTRMSEIALGEPGSAKHVEPVQRMTLHPLRWQMDEPSEVTIEVDEAYVPDVVRWLQQATREEAGDVGVRRLIYTVTHRAAMRARLYLLGERVRVLGPDDFRDEMLAELAEMTGA